MLLLDKLIFWQSKKTNGLLRSFFAKIYLCYAQSRNYIVHRNKEMFLFVNIEISRNCNRRCDYCPIKENAEFKKEERLSFSDYRTVVDQLEKMDYSANICFTGYYEPLLEEDLIKYISYAKEKVKEAKIIVYTNGDYLTKDIFDKLQEYDALLIVSLHSDDNNRYKHLLKLTKGKNTVFKRSLEKNIMSTRGGFVKVKKQEVKKMCIFPAIQLTIDASGDVILCFDDFFSKNTFGNVKEEKIIDIWRGEEFSRVRKKLLKGEVTRDICKSCFTDTNDHS